MARVSEQIKRPMKIYQYEKKYRHSNNLVTDDFMDLIEDIIIFT